MKRNKAAVLCVLLAGALLSGCTAPGTAAEQYSVMKRQSLQENRAL